MITNASGWNMAQLIHWSGAYIRYTAAKTKPIHAFDSLSRAIRYVGIAPSARAQACTTYRKAGPAPSQ